MARIFLALLLGLFPSFIHPAYANERKLALIIGVGDYENTVKLPNAAADARAFDTFLQKNGFVTTLVTNAERDGLSKSLSTFIRQLSPSDTALFYFAGHGMQFRGENYLLAREARLESEFDLASEALELTEVIGAIERRARITLVFVDACRNNPISERLVAEVEGGKRSGSVRGLAPLKTSGAGTMVAFAAEPGQVAYDGAGTNSPFTSALVDNLASPGLEVGTAFKRVIRQVRSETKDRQSPQILSSLALEFYFGTAEAGVDVSGDFLAEIDFEKAQRVGTARIWRQFLSKYPSAEQSELARSALAEITGGAGERVSPSEAEAKLRLSVAQRKEIQLALIELGYDVKTADGAFGTNTRKQMARYQKAVGITETGFANEMLLTRLNITSVQAGDEIYSSDEARRYDAADLAGLETDERILKAISCLNPREIMYGGYGGHLYVAVYTGRHVSWTEANLIATRCGGHLASITSAGENEFVATMINKDDRLFFVDWGGGWATKKGPWIGLKQDPAGREPRGGWKWTTGEPIDYSSWFEDAPNERNGVDDMGMFCSHQRGSGDMKEVFVSNWDDMGDTNSTFSFVLEFD